MKRLPERILSIVLFFSFVYSSVYAEEIADKKNWMQEQAIQYKKLSEGFGKLANILEDSIESIEKADPEDVGALYELYKNSYSKLQEAPGFLQSTKEDVTGLLSVLEESLQAMQRKITSLYLKKETAGLHKAEVLSSELPALPIALVQLNPPPEENFLNETEYQDESLSVKLNIIEHEGSTCYIAYIRIADPSQLRTAIASEKSDRNRTTSEILAQSGGVIAINGDFYTHRSTGLVVRQGKVLRTGAERRRDMLFIDDKGDFHIITRPNAKEVQEMMEAHTMVNVLSFGPALVLNGEMQIVPRDYPFEGLGTSPRTAIAQMGSLSYAMVVVDGRSDKSPGKTHQQMAELFAQMGAVHAFGLDGGGTATMSFHNKMVNTPAYDKERLLSDIVLFSSLLQSPKVEEEGKQ